QVPTYPLPDNLSNINIQRFVCRADLSMQMAIDLIQDMKTGIDHLNQRSIRKESPDITYGFSH
ncbi:glutamate decarboxylase, partial [Enterococcus hirae]